ncbi:hypothetical protein C5167_016183 [Papaver somniferum]|nr:hypothetical protein C5167_016183 [Papaver somniferum]
MTKHEKEAYIQRRSNAYHLKKTKGGGNTIQGTGSCKNNSQDGACAHTMSQVENNLWIGIAVRL